MPSIPIPHWLTPGLLERTQLRLLWFYLLAHGGIFLSPHAIYWDDWVLWNMDPAIVMDTFRQTGSVFNIGGFLHVGLLKLGPWAYKLLTFGLWLASGLALHEILIRARWTTRDTAFVIVLLYLTTPLFAGRIALILFPYTLFWSLFVLAWYMTGRIRWLALLLFAVSFNAQSLLVFYALPMLEWCCRDRTDWSIRSAGMWGLRRLDFMLLPFVWFAAKNAFFKPYGFYAGYNEGFDWRNLVPSAARQFADFAKLDVGIGTLALAALVVAISWSLFRPVTSEVGTTRQRTWLAVLGALALLLAVFPYWIIGKSPVFAQWGNRHQLLMPLGTAALVAALVFLLPSLARTGAAMAVVALFLALNWQNYASLSDDWNKQRAIIAFLGKSKEVAAADLVVFDDKAPNAFNRRIRFYEYNGMLKLAFGDERKFGVALSDLESYQSGNLDKRFVGHYNAAGHQRRDDAIAVVISIVPWSRSYRISVARP